MLCCEACFDDQFLKDYIRQHGTRGTCQYCHARGKYVIEAAELEDLFERFTRLYRPAEMGIGDPLAILIEEEWGIFSEKLLLLDKHRDLLDEVFTANCRNEEILDAPAVRDLWTSRDWHRNTLLDRWHELADELKNPEEHQPVAPGLRPGEEDLATATDTLDWFEEDVDRGRAIMPVGSRIFRARLGYREEEGRIVPFPVTEMGAPAPQLVTAPGRANPTGVSYFYAAEDERTAVAEKRPHRGALVTVAMGETRRELRILDLIAGMRLESPFECNGDYLRSLVESCELFNHLDTEFAKPLRHTDDTHEYRPTQFFAEWAKDHRYDGLRYSSAMSEGGRNLVLFNTNAVAIQTVRLVRTDDVQVVYSNYTGDED